MESGGDSTTVPYTNYEPPPRTGEKHTQSRQPFAHFIAATPPITPSEACPGEGRPRTPIDHRWVQLKLLHRRTNRTPGSSAKR